MANAAEPKTDRELLLLIHKQGIDTKKDVFDIKESMKEFCITCKDNHKKIDERFTMIENRQAKQSGGVAVMAFVVTLFFNIVGWFIKTK